MRKDSIFDLIEEAKEIYQIISNHKKISKPKVKSILEHLRSCLEYAAQDINLKLSVPKPKEYLYFPYGKTLKLFEEAAQKRLPLMKLELPDVYDAIIVLHDFKEDNSWIKVLCDFTNHAKHNGAIDVTHDSEVIKSASIGVGGLGLIGGDIANSNIRFVGCRVNGKTMDDFVLDKGKLTITKKGEIPVDFKITKDRKILVGENELDLLPFLDSCIHHIESFIDKLYRKI